MKQWRREHRWERAMERWRGNALEASALGSVVRWRREALGERVGFNWEGEGEALGMSYNGEEIKEEKEINFF